MSNPDGMDDMSPPDATSLAGMAPDQQETTGTANAATENSERTESSESMASDATGGSAAPLRHRRARTKVTTLALDLGDVRADRADHAEPRADDARHPDLNPPTVDAVARAVHARLARSRDWRTVSLEQVQGALQGMQLDLLVSEQLKTPRLQLTRLRFTGTKTLSGQGPVPIAYDQSFQPGVNVLHMPKNLCGKSTIFQLIRFALTGDPSGIAADVRPWISQLWLHFMLGDTRFTTCVEQASGTLRGYIAVGHDAVTLGEAEARGAVTVSRFDDGEQAAVRLQDFFFERLHLAPLGWTHTQDGVTSDHRMSWRTYWQALAVPDSSEDYLMVSKENATGNQQGLLLSMLLGLRFAEPINSLHVEGRKLELKAQGTSEERRLAVAARDQLAASVAALDAELARLSAAPNARHAAFDTRGDAQALHATLVRHEERLAELRDVTRRRDELAQAVLRERAQARSLRETADLRLHFTGLAVSLCPNCDEDVAPEAIAREQASHDCRLCGKAARPAEADDADALRAEADDKEQHAAVLAEQRDELTRLVRNAQDAVERDAAEMEAIRERLRAGVEVILPTPDELAARDEVLLRLGAARGALTQAIAAVERLGDLEDDAPMRAAVMSRARDIVREVAERMNAELLAELNRLSQQMIGALGAESVSEVQCSTVGTLTLLKNGAKVSFGSVSAPGERLRIKLAFYLAMMRLGRIAGHGRHPGFLMIDQPGSDEMIDENFATLATMLRDIDTEFADETQLFCFTARPPFMQATAPEKVYGPQAGEWMF